MYQFKMALSNGLNIYVLISKNTKKNVILSIGNYIQSFISTSNYCTSKEYSQIKISRAMKAHLDRKEKFNKFIQEQLEEYELGKKFLKGMMGIKSQEMTQKEVDEAIQYLFPSCLFVPKARPMMKSPEELYKGQKDAAFDYSGRPYHFLFYTMKPLFSQTLHEAAKELRRLNYLAAKKQPLPEKLILTGTSWCSMEDLRSKFREKIYETEYNKFLEVFDAIAQHPYATLAKDFLNPYWKQAQTTKEREVSTIVEKEEGIKVATVERAQKKTCLANVSVTHPGTGKILINNMGIDYFPTVTRREQVLFPLLFTGLLNKVDVKAEVNGSGYASQAGAVRYGIAQCLKNFVSPDMKLEMKIAGLLERDVRRRERKKPGREGARRKYTWLKR